MSRRRYAAAAPLPVRVERLLSLPAPTPAVALDVLSEHPEAAKLYSEDAAEWITDRELSAPYFNDTAHAVMMAEVNRDHAIDDWFRSLGFAGSELFRSALYSARLIGFGMPPLESSVLHLPALRWSARCAERQHVLTTPQR
ncbi:hypothetical protein ABZ078_41325 [Streptomyces sp. NPDC006385]|uniref:hypothetical protein n=1 Tax=Streptomyces sp. NPDC006385 TaxID=3156761 RepID=UPI0033AE7201